MLVPVWQRFWADLFGRQWIPTLTLNFYQTQYEYYLLQNLEELNLQS